MKLKNIKNIKNIKGKRVILRLDFNINLKNNKVLKDSVWRLERSIPTIKYLLRKKAKIIIVSHLGRPKGKDKNLSLLPVSNYFSKLINKKIEFWSNDFKEYYQDSLNLDNGDIVMLENIRFYEREKYNCKRLAKSLSKLGDIYVNDAFAVLHRKHSSVLAITEYLPSYAGLLIQKEVNTLEKVLNTKGLVAIFGGFKVKTKIKLLKKFINISDKILLGGVLANTFLKAQGYSMKASIIEKDSVNLAKRLMNNKIILPVDVSVATSLKSKNYKIINVNNIPKNGSALDIGSKTIKEYSKILKKAKIIVWNGPLGYFENINFSKGSKDLAKEIIKFKIKTIIGGGETVYLITKNKMRDKFYFVSTGGGAMLAFLEGSKLPALEKLK